MRPASEASGAERSEKERRHDPRLAGLNRTGSLSETEATCRRIAEYLIDVSRESRLEPALLAFLRTFEQKRAELDAASRSRSQSLADSILRRDGGPEGAAIRERCDPYFWG